MSEKPLAVTGQCTMRIVKNEWGMDQFVREPVPGTCKLVEIQDDGSWIDYPTPDTTAAEAKP